MMIEAKRRSLKKSRELSGIKKKILAVFWGVSGGAIACFLMLLIFSAILSISSASSSIAKPIATAVLFLSAFICGYISSRILKEKGILIGAVSGAIYFLLYAIIGLIFGSKSLQAAVSLKFIIAVVSSAIGGVIGVNRRR